MFHINQEGNVMIRYINRRGDNQLETVDSLDSGDFSSLKDFKKALRNLVGEYNLSDPSAEYYSSQRSTKCWS